VTSSWFLIPQLFLNKISEEIQKRYRERKHLSLVQPQAEAGK